LKVKYVIALLLLLVACAAEDPITTADLHDKSGEKIIPK